MLHESAVPTNSSYLVPCVYKAVQMIEALRETRAGLRVEDFLEMTGYSRSTIYRILRTLTACRYIVRETGGVYRLNQAVILVANENTRARTVRSPGAPTGARADSLEEFERWGVRFRRDGQRVPLARRVSRIAAPTQAEA